MPDDRFEFLTKAEADFENNQHTLNDLSWLDKADELVHSRTPELQIIDSRPVIEDAEDPTPKDVVAKIPGADDGTAQKVGNFLGKFVNAMRGNPDKQGFLPGLQRFAANLTIPGAIENALGFAANIEGSIENIREKGFKKAFPQNLKNSLKLMTNSVTGFLIGAEDFSNQVKNELMYQVGSLTKEDRDVQNLYSKAKKEFIKDQVTAEVDNDHLSNMLHSTSARTLQYFHDKIQETEQARPEGYGEGDFSDNLDLRFLPYFLQNDFARALGSSVGSLIVGGGAGVLTRRAVKTTLETAVVKYPMGWAGKLSTSIGDKVLTGSAKNAFTRMSRQMTAENIEKNISRFATLHGMTSSEAALESIDAYDSYMAEHLPGKVEELKAQGVPEAEAAEQAVVALDPDATRIASNVYTDNYAMLLLTNTVELSALFGMKGSTFKNAKKALTTKLGKAGGKAAFASGKLAAGSLSESFEEAYQYGVQEYEKSKDLETADSFTEISVAALDTVGRALKDGDPEAWLSVILGGLAGGVMNGAGAIGSKIRYQKNFNKLKNLSSVKNYTNWQDQYTVDKDGKLQVKDAYITQKIKDLGDTARKIALKEHANERGNWKLKELIDKELISDMVYDASEKGDTGKGIVDKFKKAFNIGEANLVQTVGQFVEESALKDGVGQYYDAKGKPITFDDFITNRTHDIEFAVQTKAKTDGVANAIGMSSLDRKKLFQLSINENTNAKMKADVQKQIDMLEQEDTSTLDKKILEDLKKDLQELEKAGQFYSDKISDMLNIERAQKEKRKEDLKENIEVQKEVDNIVNAPNAEKQTPTLPEEPIIEGEEDADLLNEIQKEEEYLNNLEEQEFAELEKENLIGELNRVDDIHQANSLIANSNESLQEEGSQIINDRLQLQANESDSLNGPVRTRSQETLFDDLSNRWDATRKLLASKEKEELAGALTKNRSIKKLFDNIDKLKDESFIESLPKYLKEAPVSLEEIVNMTPAAVAYLSTVNQFKPIINEYFKIEKENLTPYEEEQATDKLPEFTEENVVDEVLSPTVEEEIVPDEEAQEIEIDVAQPSVVETVDDIPKFKYKKIGSKMIGNIFFINTRKGMISNKKETGSNAPIPYKQGNVFNFWFFKNEDEYQNAIRFQSRAKMQNGLRTYLEIDPDALYFSQDIEKNRSNLMVQFVVYADPETLNPVDKGTPGALRIPLGSLKNPNNGEFIKEEYEWLTEVRKEAWEKYQARSGGIIDLNRSVTLKDIDYGINQQRLGPKDTVVEVTSNSLFDALSGVPHEIAYYFQGSWRVVKKGNATPGLSKSLWLTEGKADFVQKGEYTQYSIDPSVAGIVTGDKVSYGKPVVIMEPVPGKFLTFTLFPAKVRESSVVEGQIKEILNTITPDNIATPINKLKELVSYKLLQGSSPKGPTLRYDREKNKYETKIPAKFTRYLQNVLQETDLVREVGDFAFVYFDNPTRLFEIANLGAQRINMPNYSTQLVPDLANGLQKLIGEGRLTTDIDQQYPIVPIGQFSFDTNEAEDNTATVPDKIIGYQGFGGTLDNRDFNYFTLSETEASQYGEKVRRVEVDPEGFLRKRTPENEYTEEYSNLTAEFTKDTGLKFDILDNSPEGLTTQTRFFEFLRTKGYKGYIEFLPGSAENAYFVTFNAPKKTKSKGAGLLRDIRKSFFEAQQLDNGETLPYVHEQLTAALKKIGYGNGQGDIALGDLLSSLLQSQPDSRFKSTMERYLNKLRDSGTKVKFDDSIGSHYDMLNDTLSISLSQVASRYLRQNANLSALTPEEMLHYVLSHEVAHTYTSSRVFFYETLQEPGIGQLASELSQFSKEEKEALDQYFAIYEYLKTNPELRGEYAFSTPSEMVAESVNLDIQEKLKRIPVPPQLSVRGNSIWSQIKQLINRLLGIQTSAFDVIDSINEFFLDRAQKRSTHPDVVKIREFFERGQLQNQTLDLNDSFVTTREMSEFYNRFLMDLYLKDHEDDDIRERGLQGLLEKGVSLDKIYEELDEYAQIHLDNLNEELEGNLDNAVRLEIEYAKNKVERAIRNRKEESFWMQELKQDLGISHNLIIRSKIERNRNTEIPTEEEDNLEDANIEGAVENWQVELFSTNPLSKISERLHHALNNIPVAILYRPDERGRMVPASYQLNDMKIVEYHNGGDLFGKLLGVLDGATSVQEIEPLLIQASEVYPWINDLVSKMDEDPNLVRDIWNGIVNWNRIPFRRVEKVIEGDQIQYIDKRSDLPNEYSRVWNRLSSKFYSSAYWNSVLKDKVGVSDQKYLFRLLDQLGIDPNRYEIGSTEIISGQAVVMEAGQMRVNKKLNINRFFPELRKSFNQNKVPSSILTEVLGVVGTIPEKITLKQANNLRQRMYSFGVLYHSFLINHDLSENQEGITRAASYAVGKLQEFDLISTTSTDQLVDKFQTRLGEISSKIQRLEVSLETIKEIQDAYSMVGITLPEDLLRQGYLTGSKFKRNRVAAGRFLSIFTNPGVNPQLTKLYRQLKAGDNVFADIRGNLTTITNVLTQSIQTQPVNTFTNVDGNLRYPYMRPNFLTQLNKILANGTKRDAFIQSRTPHRFHKKAPIYKLLKEPTFKFEFFVNEGNLSGDFGKSYARFNEADIYSNQFFSWYSAYKRSPTYGNYTVPPMSDSPTAYGISATTFNPKQVIEHLRGVFGQELSRIEATNKLSVKNYDTNKNQFHFFQSLNTEIDGKTVARPDVLQLARDIRENPNKITELDRLLDQELNQRFRRYLETLHRIGILVYDRTSRQLVPNPTVADSRLVSEPNLEEVMRTFYYNQFLYNTQTITLLGLDPAFYKNSADFVKRFKQAHTPGLLSGEEAETSLTSRTIILKDIVQDSEESLKQLAQKLTGKNRYTNNDITDGGSIVTLDFQRRKSYEFSEWNKDKERVYEKLQRGDVLTLEDHQVSFNVNKPHQYSVNSVPLGENDSVLVPTQVKNSEYTLTPNLAYQRKDGSYKRPKSEDYSDYQYPKLAKILHIMEKKGIDKVQFASNFKVGLPTDKIYDLDELTLASDIQTVDQFGKDYKKVQDSSEKFRDAAILLGTQVRKLIMTHIEPDTRYPVKINKPSRSLLEKLGVTEITSLTGKQIKELYEELISDNVDEDLGSILNGRSVYSVMFEYAQSKNLSPLIADRLYGEALDYLADPTFSRQFETMINSVFKKAVRTKIPGAALVNEPSVGFSDQLKVVTKDNVVQYYEVALPVWKSSILNHFADKNGFVDPSKIDDSAKEAFFYRIPTEGKYSMLPVKIKYFTPTSAGPVIYFPAEFTKTTDADFDFDKVYGFMKEVEVEFENLDQIANLTVNLMKSKGYVVPQFSIKNQLRSFFSGELDIESLEEGSSLRTAMEVAATMPTKPIKIVEKPASLTNKAGRTNLLIDLMTSVIRTEEASKDLLEGASFQELINLREELKTLNKKDKVQVSVADPVDLNTFTYNNVVGKNYIGVFANTNSFHALIQNTDVNLRIAEPVFDLQRIDRRESEVKGRTIERNLAIGVNASVENSKDAVWSEIGVNDFTVGPVSLLISMGASWKRAVYFVNQPIIKDYVRYASLESLKGMATWQIVDNFKARVGVDEDTRGSNWSVEQLQEGLTKRSQQTDAQLFKDFSDLFKYSSDYVSLTLAVKADSGNVGPTLLDVMRFLNSMSQESTILSEAQLVPQVEPELTNNDRVNYVLRDENKSIIPSLNAYYNVLMEEMNFTAENFVYLTKYPYTLIHRIISEAGVRIPSEKVYRKMYTETINMLMQNHPDYRFESYEDKRSFIRNFPFKFKEVLQDPRYKALDEVIRFEPVEKVDGLFKLSMTNIFTLNPQEINRTKRMVNELPREIQKDFIRYVVNTSGLEYSSRSLSIILPDSVLYDGGLVNYFASFQDPMFSMQTRLLVNNAYEWGGIVPLIDAKENEVVVTEYKGEAIRTFLSDVNQPVIRLRQDKKTVVAVKIRELEEMSEYEVVRDLNMTGLGREYRFPIPVFPELTKNNIHHENLQDGEVRTDTETKDQFFPPQDSATDISNRVKTGLEERGYDPNKAPDFNKFVEDSLTEGLTEEEIIGKFIKKFECNG